MGENLQSKCYCYRGGKESGEEGEEGEVVLYAVSLPFVLLGLNIYDRGFTADRNVRKPKHDRGSVEGEVKAYLKRRRLIRSGALGVKDPNMSMKRPEQAKSGVKAS